LPRAENLLAQEKLRWLIQKKCEKMPVEKFRKSCSTPTVTVPPHDTGIKQRLNSIDDWKIDCKRRVRAYTVITRATCIFSTSRFRRLWHPREKT